MEHKKENPSNIDIKKGTDLFCIDSLKGIGAVIIAFFWHYQHFDPKEFPLQSIFTLSYSYGYLMVEMFFMLSGFGMALGYQKKIQNREISFPIYIKKRFSKLYPPFLVTLFVTGLLECIHIALEKVPFVYGNFDLYHFLLNILLLQNSLINADESFNAPAWCISICMFCYILFYALSYKYTKERTLFYISIVGVIFSLYLFSKVQNTIFSNQIARGTSCFSIGIMLSYAWRYKKCINYHYLGKLLWMLLIGGYISIRYNPDIVGNIQLLFILGISPIIILCTLFNKHINHFLQNKILVFWELSP